MTFLFRADLARITRILGERLARDARVELTGPSE